MKDFHENRILLSSKKGEKLKKEFLLILFFRRG